MTNKKAQTASERKKLERDNWRAEGGTFKEIKLTKSGAEILVSGREKEGLEKDWEFINYLLNKYENTCD